MRRNYLKEKRKGKKKEKEKKNTLNVGSTVLKTNTTLKTPCEGLDMGTHTHSGVGGE